MMCTRMLAIQSGRGRTLRNFVAGLVVVCAGASGQPVCPSYFNGPPPGVAEPLWNPRLMNSGKLPQTVFYHLSEDILRITVEDGSRLNLTDNQMVVGFAARDYGGAYGVQVSAYDCITKDSTISMSWSPVQMTLSATGTLPITTLVFSKPKWWGMVDMYSLDTRYFWPMWGGKIVTIYWFDSNSDFFTGGIANYQIAGQCPVTTTLSPPFTFAPCIPMLPVRIGEFFDWDRRADRVLFYNGQWSMSNSGSGATSSRNWGLAGDVPVPADYDSDGRTDLAVWRPSTGEWWITRSNDGTTRTIQWGTAGDVPLPADYDGDGRIDLAVFRPSTGVWWIRNGLTDAMSTVQWGMPGDVPVSGDFDGDGIADPAVWRPSTGTWSIWQSSTRSARAVQWGASGDIPVPADYDGDGKTDLAVWRPSSGVWWFIDSSTGAMRTVQWGQTGDVPVPADYDGDGKADVAVWRRYNPATFQNGEWWTIASRNGARTVAAFGSAGDKPVPTR